MANILVIEDEIEIQGILRNLLEREGYHVFDASEGGEGIKLYGEKRIDLVITDLFMPGKDGIETIIQLRQDFPHVKIIAISGGGRMEPGFFLECARSFGAVGTFAKPFNCKELLAAVKKHVREL